MMFGKKHVIQKQFAAVHMITESGDHYNHLVEHVTSWDIVNYLIGQMGDEFYNCDDWYITAENPSISASTDTLISSKIHEYWEEITP